MIDYAKLSEISRLSHDLKYHLDKVNEDIQKIEDQGIEVNVTTNIRTDSSSSPMARMRQEKQYKNTAIIIDVFVNVLGADKPAEATDQFAAASTFEIDTPPSTDERPIDPDSDNPF